MTEPLLCEISVPGRVGIRFPEPDVPLAKLPDNLRREHLPMPELSEVDVVRHFTRLSQLNYCIDVGMYPLGSCTMKYNPKVNEETARLAGFALTHPLQPVETAQGNLMLMYELQEWLKEIGGFAGVTLQPAAGAQGELTGVLIIRAYHIARNDTKRNKILIPDSAHGTNPATSAMSGMVVVEIQSDSRGNVDLDALRAQCDDTLAGLMLTNPNTLGLFDENVLEVIRLVHEAGGLVYGDGANMNALLGIVRPGDLGIDVLHFNLHKTFSTPHGGGGPGAGPVGVKNALAPYLPVPVVRKLGGPEGDGFTLDYDFPLSIGRLHANFGNVGMLVRAYAYIRSLGPDGLRRCAEMAVLNANYLLARLRGVYHVPYDRRVMHECVLSDRNLEPTGVTTLDVAKRLIDYGYHPPTVYFPLIVHGALMIEPTESESLEGLDRFVDAMLAIAEEARESPELVRTAPHHTRRSRLDETRAARQPVLRWQPEEPA
jgi:glycine dehydrogenase subunit 2